MEEEGEQEGATTTSKAPVDNNSSPAFIPVDTTSSRKLTPQNNNQEVNENEEGDEEDDDWFADMKSEIATNVASVTKLAPSFLLFLFREEFPTIILCITFQACFNFASFFQYKHAFGINREMDLFAVDYNAGDLDCMWRQFEKELSSIIAILTTFVPFA